MLYLDDNELSGKHKDKMYDLRLQLERRRMRATMMYIQLYYFYLAGIFVGSRS